MHVVHAVTLQQTTILNMYVCMCICKYVCIKCYYKTLTNLVCQVWLAKCHDSSYNNCLIASYILGAAKKASLAVLLKYFSPGTVGKE